MRSEQKPERRFIELRADDAGISGVALRYGDEARFGDFRERFTPGSVAIQQDVVANIMHDRAKPVARIGARLTLRESGGAIMARIATATSCCVMVTAIRR
ncbi:MAG: hypothetical protein F4089_04860, partial [Gammaproteobacteria bacterium]|nr:hypothetical protein [Gammaproteobacteria bacterium]